MKRPRKPKKITVEWLKKQNACETQVERFKELFPRGAFVTAKNYMKAFEGGLDLDWLEDILPARIRWNLHTELEKNAKEWGDKYDRLVILREGGKINETTYRRRNARLDKTCQRKDGKAFAKAWEKWGARRR